MSTSIFCSSLAHLGKREIAEKLSIQKLIKLLKFHKALWLDYEIIIIAHELKF